MNIEKITQNGKTVAVITSDGKVLTNVQSALDLIMTAKYEVGTNLIVIDKNTVAEDFFIMLAEAYPQSVTTKYYCPLTIQVHNRDCYGDIDEDG